MFHECKRPAEPISGRQVGKNPSIWFADFTLRNKTMHPKIKVWKGRKDEVGVFRLLRRTSAFPALKSTSKYWGEGATGSEEKSFLCPFAG